MVNFVNSYFEECAVYKGLDPSAGCGTFLTALLERGNLYEALGISVNRDEHEIGVLCDAITERIRDRIQGRMPSSP